MDIARWSAEEARSAIAGAHLDRQLGVPYGVPALVVALRDADDGADIAEAVQNLPVIAIATGGDPAAAWDLALNDHESVTEGILHAPRAATIAAQTLRRTARLSPADGLLVESLAYATLQTGPEFADWLASQGHRTRTDQSPRVNVEIEADGTAAITLTRGRLRNLLDAQMRDELVDAFRALSINHQGLIQITGEGPGFCAGGDPAEFGTVSDPVTAHLIRSNANVAPWIMSVAARTEAIVHGPCVGAGVELAAFCRRVVARPDARFRLPETQMGLLPGAGGTVSIPRRIGRQRTLEWLLTGAEIDATQAMAWGLVDAITE